MILEKKGLRFFQFPHLSGCSGVQHAIFTRENGHSQAPYDNLNVSTKVGDSPGYVQKNRQAIMQCMEATDLVFIRQVHGAEVEVIKNGEETPRKIRQHQNLIGDALITNVPHVHLVIQVADCQPVLIADPVKRVIANVHSGWRGSIQNVIGRTVQKMIDVFACRPHHLMAGIGPSLGPCCAEFINYQTEIPAPLWQYKDNTDHFNFWAISRMQLLESGLLEKNIINSNLCTRCRSDLFFSYRGEKKTGRFASVIGLTL